MSSHIPEFYESIVEASNSYKTLDEMVDYVESLIRKLKLLGVAAPIIVLPRGINKKIINCY